MATGSKSAWRSAVEEYRERKDEYFADDPHSPIPSGAREAFEGLDYYPPDPAYRVEAELHEHEPKQTITVLTTTDGEREYVEWGEFRFELDGEPLRLQAYRAHEGEEGFWVPFRDETNGEETYGAGRYLDIDPEDDRADGDRWVLDFNLAYSPFCVYSEHYECPLVPMENWLKTRIEAGEKTYHGVESHAV